MESEPLSIGELADAAGLSRRAIRFYVQQKLIPAPLGRGRGRHYDARHLATLRRVTDLQRAGHSLESIRQLLARSETDQDEGAAPDETLGVDGASHGECLDTSPDGRARLSDDPTTGFAKPQAAGLTARLWTRLTLADGVELSYDTTRFNPTVEDLLRIRQFVRETFSR